MTFEDDFTSWLNYIQPDLKSIFAVLRKQLHREPEELIADLVEAEAHNARCCYILAQANSFLDKASLFYLPSRDEADRELDRKTLLESRVAHIREMRDKIEGMCNAIKQRLILGESVLGYQRSFNLSQGTKIV